MACVRAFLRPITREPGRGQWLLTADGVRVSAHHDPVARRTDGVGQRDLAIVTAHGFTMSWRSPDSRRVARLLSEDAGVIGFDFRGHGGSSGHSTVGDREVLDVDAAVRWARLLGYQRVATLGWSMGAAVVVRHAGLRDRPLATGEFLSGRTDAVAAVSGPSRWHYTGTPAMRRIDRGITTAAGRAVVRHLFGTRVLAAGWAQEPDAPAVLAASVSPTPFLVVHGDADPFFPLDHAQALHAACDADSGAELWVEPGFGHAEMAASDDLVRRIGGWLREASGAASARMP
jgi:pimeloyl-ACP methyl ester carboxylesterase